MWMTIDEYAKRRGVSAVAIRKHLYSGRIPNKKPFLKKKKPGGKHVLINKKMADVAMSIEAKTGRGNKLDGSGGHRYRRVQNRNIKSRKKADRLLRDYIVVNRLRSQIGRVTVCDIPQWLIELKREQLTLHREIKKLKGAIKNGTT